MRIQTSLDNWGEASQGAKVYSHTAFTFPDFRGVAQGSILLGTDLFRFLTGSRWSRTPPPGGSVSLRSGLDKERAEPLADELQWIPGALL